MSIGNAYVHVLPDMSGFIASVERAKASFDRLADTMARMQRNVWALLEEQRVPEVWEAFGMRLMDEPRPAYGPESPEYLAAVDDTAADVVRYLTQVARIREKETA